MQLVPFPSVKAYDRVCRETNRKCNLLSENPVIAIMQLYTFLVYSLFAFIVCAGALRKSTQESHFETS